MWVDTDVSEECASFILRVKKIRVHVGTAVIWVKMKFSCFGGLQRMWPVRAMGMGEEIESIWIDKNCEMG